MKTLDQFTKAELMEELMKRDRIEKEAGVPKPVENMDFSGVINICKGHISDIKNHEEDDDSKHYIYEAAMEAVFGSSVFDWINKQ